MLRVMVEDVLQQGADLDFDAQFFAQFAVEALFKRFARFAFAAREFPKAAQRPAGQSPGNQQFSTAKNQAGGNFDWIFL